MNKKKLYQLIDLYARNYSELAKVCKEICRTETAEVPQNLIQSRTYYEKTLDNIRDEIHNLVNPSPNWFSFKNFTICIGVFFIVVLSVRAVITGDILMAGVAGIFPFLIYPVRCEK